MDDPVAAGGFLAKETGTRTAEGYRRGCWQDCCFGTGVAGRDSHGRKRLWERDGLIPPRRRLQGRLGPVSWWSRVLPCSARSAGRQRYCGPAPALECIMLLADP